ncbi:MULTISPECIES: class C beta-lactamase [Rhizobium/Agrobacterium group]|uniref:Beta-lactamase n=1 Tax=Agrobacterium genomosp. 2 str. CFBP 5494 TaxID=1183436 RepID=A0A9W5B3Q4_9HYPH|nr:MULTISPECIES: class C beta-lactamase [Rhizobium/Agrobacterium group]PZU74358.1 MAG: class C beta-lactamase [Rhizobium sp.]WMW57128.1 class C beta-lactamase [Agrobacterium pusense]CAD7035446.1 class C beta-lactamase [Rhizobium sp. P007]CUW96524.1 beta-lactamase, cephalosporinase, precursor [Agrobacterium genomosp. 2 str. CFBP 5494]
MNFHRRHIVWTAMLSAILLTPALAADEARLKAITDAAIKPIMEKNGIPGLAVGISVDGESYIFTYGVMSKSTGQPVTAETLFELGSISKTFTATLATYAEANGHLSLSGRVRDYLPGMKGTAFGDVTLTHLGTHTAGGFPLQVPDNVKTETQLLAYLKSWKPSYGAGTHRTYANPSIGMLGYITAKAMGQGYDAAMQDTLFPALGLKDTFTVVPQAKLANYAQGYTRNDEPARLTPGILSSEAYGVRSTATDMIRFVNANLGLEKLDGKIRQAIASTHTGYFAVGAMTQDLVWEQYARPVALKTLVQSNSGALLKTVPVQEIAPPLKPGQDVFVNKTGSTNGFGAYVAFIPQRKLGIVILANKNYPNEDRVTAAVEILTAVDKAD